MLLSGIAAHAPDAASSFSVIGAEVPDVLACVMKEYGIKY